MSVKKRKSKKRKQESSQEPLDTTMSLGDHLEELRGRLIRAIIGLVLGAAVCLIFGRRIVHFIESPYEQLRQEQKFVFGTSSELQNDLDNNIISKDLQQGFEDKNISLSPDVAISIEQKGQRWLIINNKDRYIISKEKDKLSIYYQKYPDLPELKFFGPPDIFVGYMKIAVISGLILSSPWVFYQLWMFIAAGLYTHEKRYVHYSVPFSAALFVAGALFFLFVVAPISLRFFLNFGKYIGYAPMWEFRRYISFITILMLVFGIGFQTPIAVFVLNRVGLVSIQALREARKFVFVGVFILAALATPPDVISQVTLAIPLYLLFELGILFSYIAGRREKP